jgi:hypothetical protein
MSPLSEPPVEDLNPKPKTLKGLDTLTHGMSPLTDPPVVWEKQLCPRAGQIYFMEDPKVALLRKRVYIYIYIYIYIYYRGS